MHIYIYIYIYIGISVVSPREVKSRGDEGTALKNIRMIIAIIIIALMVVIMILIMTKAVLVPL